MTQGLSLVTGAAGHVGFNIVKLLHQRGTPVRAGIRTLRKRDYLKEFGCEVVEIELMNPASLEKAMEGVEVVYAAAAAFLMWAKDPENDIVRPNVEGTANLLRAAAKAGVRKVVYVSSMVTLDIAQQPLREDTWNPLRKLPYEYSKTDAEKLALQLAKELNLDISTVLPGGIWGPDFPEPSPSTGTFAEILANRIPIDPNLHILISDVRDVARACLLAAEKGKPGERYMVVNEKPVSTGKLFEFAHAHYPELAIKIPKVASRGFLLAMAYLTQFLSRFTGKPAPLSPALVRLYWGADYLRADISKARHELGIELTPLQDTINDSFAYAKRRFLQPAG